MTTLTNEQITAGSNVLCDCPEPKRIGRNAAIDVFDAMTGAAREAPVARVTLNYGTGAARVRLLNGADLRVGTCLFASTGAAPAAMQALRDLLKDVQAGVMDGDAARDAQALIDKYDEPEAPISDQALLNAELQAQEDDHSAMMRARVTAHSAATTASASIGDDQEFHRLLDACLHAESFGGPKASETAEWALIRYLDLRAPAPSRNAAPAKPAAVLHCTRCHTTTRHADGKCTDCGNSKFKTWAEIVAPKAPEGGAE